MAKTNGDLTAMRDDYNEHSKDQLQVLDLAIPFIKTGINAHSATLKSDASTPILTIADFGASTGANSSSAMSLIIDGFRQKYGFEKTSSILVVHEDLPKNNWTELFNYIHKNGESYLKKHKGVQALASGVSFYEQVLPDNSLHFGFSNVSLHWLSNLPCKIENHCLPERASPGERQLFKEQAAKDWQAFLTARSVELVKGGILVLHVMARDENGLVVITDALYAALMRICHEGVVTREEILDFNVRVVFRSLEDVNDEALFDRLGLELVLAKEAQPIPSDFYLLYKQHNDVDRWANDSSQILMAVFEPTFLEALSSERTIAEKKLICTKLSAAYAEEMKKLDPERFSEVRGNIFVVLKKK